MDDLERYLQIKEDFQESCESLARTTRKLNSLVDETAEAIIELIDWSSMPVGPEGANLDNNHNEDWVVTYEFPNWDNRYSGFNDVDDWDGDVHYQFVGLTQNGLFVYRVTGEDSENYCQEGSCKELVVEDIKALAQLLLSELKRLVKPE